MTMLKFFRFVGAPLAFSIFVGVTSVAAHANTGWILPSTSFLSEPGVISFDAAISKSPFHADKFPMRMDGLSITSPDGGRVVAENIIRLRKRSVFDLYLQQVGTYKVSVTTQEIDAAWRERDGTEKSVRGNTGQVLRRVPSDVETVMLTERIQRHETFVVVGQPSDVAAAGFGLELRFLRDDASMLKVGKNRARFVLLLDGRPAAKVWGTIIRGRTHVGSQAEVREFITSAAGEFSVEWWDSGFYLLEAKVADAKTTIPRARKRNLSYTATFEVSPAN